MAFDKRTEEDIALAMSRIEHEMRRAIAKYGPFTSSHEGYAVLLEEVDELWDEIKNNKLEGTESRQFMEATQVGAMAGKFLVSLRNEQIK